MKYFDIIILVIIISLVSQSFCQVQEDKLRLLYTNDAKYLAKEGFDTTDYVAMRRLVDTTDASHIGSSAALFLAQRGINDVVDNVHSQYYNTLDEPGGCRFEYLYALYLMGGTLGHQLIYDFIDTISIRYSQQRAPYSTDDVYSAIRLLVNNGDYSRFSIFRFFTDINKRRSIGVDFGLLIAFAQKPELRDSVYNILLELTNPIYTKSIRYMSVFSLRKFTDKPETQAILRQVARTDTSESVIDESLITLQVRYNDYFALSMRAQIANTTNDTLIYSTYMYWIGRFRAPISLYTMIDIHNRRPTMYGYWTDLRIKQFIPSEPPKDEQVFVSIDSLRIFKNQVAAYNWLGNHVFVNELEGNINSARNYLTQDDSINCARQIKFFQQKVDEEYRDSLDGDNKFVTIEGWKFLYWNAEYILERLPTPPPQYLLNINIVGSGTVNKNPNLAIYDSSTTVQLTATPSTGFNFTGWSGDATGTGTKITITMNGNKNITATFVR